MKTTNPDTLIISPPTNLEEFVVLCVCVAGKRASVVRERLDLFWDRLLQELHYGSFPGEVHEWWARGPFEILRQYNASGIATRLREAGIGCHTTKGRALHELSWANFDLANVTPQQLETIHGIGPKTSRFFVLYTQPNSKIAVLDTHILAWMRLQGVDAPKSTPTGKRYLELEKVFLSMVPKGRSVAEFDLEIWLSRRM